MVDHHIHGVAGPYRNLAAGPLELLDGDQAFALVPEIDDDILGRDTQDRALQNLVGRGRGEVAVIVEKILVAFGDFLLHLPAVLVYGHHASADHVFTNVCKHLIGRGRQRAREIGRALLSPGSIVDDPIGQPPANH
jgi:hypothetical protein